jgi:glycerophosphoryl diester phosphodiesterase
MPRLTLALIAIVLVGCAPKHHSKAPEAPEMTGPAAEFLRVHTEKPVVIAHRGASGHAPENTLAAYSRALELGAIAAETDVFLSADKRVIAIHDETLERTTNGSGRVDETPFEHLRTLDAGSWFDPSFSEERLPELGELLDLINNQLILCIEIKNGDGIELAIRDLLDQRDARKHVVFFSFNPEKVKLTKELMPDVPSLYLEHVREPPYQYPADLVDRAVALGADAIGVSRRGVHTVDISAAHDANLPVFVYTVNEPEDVDQMLELQVDGIISDFPKRTLDRVISQAR